MYFYIILCENDLVKISACIITFNEENNIASALESLEWADEIVVVDSESTDKTRDICEKFGAKVVIQKWLGFSKQKQFAVDQCSHKWVFSLDADEMVSNDLKDEIKLIKKQAEPTVDGYRISRLSHYMNRPIRYCGWYPDWQLRLFNREKGKWADVLIHESFQLNSDAKTKRIRRDILHKSIPGSVYHAKMICERYAPMSAEQMFRNGKTTSKISIATVGIIAFIKVFFFKLGVLDGFPGFCIARFAAHHAFLKHMILWEKLKSEK